jgi:hypothetical protein
LKTKSAQVFWGPIAKSSDKIPFSSPIINQFVLSKTLHNMTVANQAKQQ